MIGAERFLKEIGDGETYGDHQNRRTPKEGLVAVVMIQQRPNSSDVASKRASLVDAALMESRQ